MLGANWRLKKRAYWRGRVNVVVENPLDSALWNMEFTKLLWRCMTLLGTSYCHYGGRHRKRTGFCTTLADTPLMTPCPSNRCKLQTHADWTTLRIEERNSIPEALVVHFLDEWERRHISSSRKHMLLIDVFTGFGSVTRVAKRRSIPVCANDLLKQRAGSEGLMLDMETFNLSMLEQLALYRNEFEREDTSVLFWISTPCLTYSIDALHHHRPKHGDRSDLAIRHDRMNERLFQELYQLLSSCYTPVSHLLNIVRLHAAYHLNVCATLCRENDCILYILYTSDSFRLNHRPPNHRPTNHRLRRRSKRTMS